MKLLELLFFEKNLDKRKKEFIIDNRLYKKGGIMNKRRKTIKLFSLCILIILFSFQMVGEYKNRHDIDIQYVTVMDKANMETENKQEEKENKILNLRKEYKNNDITGFVSIDGTNISEPILKYKDNDYYLHHNSYGNYEINGSIFQDYRINLEDRKVLIYGHSSIYDDIPFNELEKYYNKSFYDSHKYIKLVTEDNEYLYEIFSVYVETSDFTYVNLKISDDMYNEHLKKYKSNSLYDTGVSVTDGDEVIILQTCSNDNKYKKYRKKYLLVIGKKIFKEV